MSFSTVLIQVAAHLKIPTAMSLENRTKIAAATAAEIRYGKVQTYLVSGSYGFLSPEKPFEDKTLHFRNEHGRLPHEQTLGNLSFHPDLYARPLDDRDQQYLPKAGDEIVYIEGDGKPNPIARRWSYALDWNRCMKTIDSRPAPDQPLARAYYVARDYYSKIIVWEGFLDRLVNIASKGDFFPEIPDLCFEQRLAHGWQRITDVRKNSFREETGYQSPVEGEKFKSKSMRFYLALLIERGISMMKDKLGSGVSTTTLRYAAIGRARKVNGNHRLWGLEDRLPNTNPGILRTIWGVSLLTNLDPLFLRLTLGYPDNDGKSHAEWMIDQLRSGNDVGLLQSASDSQVVAFKQEIEAYKSRIH